MSTALNKSDKDTLISRHISAVEKTEILLKNLSNFKLSVLIFLDGLRNNLSESRDVTRQPSLGGGIEDFVTKSAAVDPYELIIEVDDLEMRTKFEIISSMFISDKFDELESYLIDFYCSILGRCKDSFVERYIKFHKFEDFPRIKKAILEKSNTYVPISLHPDDMFHLTLRVNGGNLSIRLSNCEWSFIDDRVRGRFFEKYDMEQANATLLIENQRSMVLDQAKVLLDKESNLGALSQKIVKIGSRIKLLALDGKNRGQIFHYSIGIVDATSKTVSMNSPFGKALAGAKIKDQVEIELPTETVVFEVLSVD